MEPHRPLRRTSTEPEASPIAPQVLGAPVPAEPGPLLHATTRAEWRAWLEAHHDTEAEVWLVIHPKASGRPFVDYDDAVEEALCFGWIDSTVRSLGGGPRAQRYTPRRPGSGVSEMNRARVRRLVREDRMTPAGMAALPGVEAWLDPPPLVVPPDIEAALRDGGAWETFRSFPEAYRRIRVGWIDGARKRPDEFRKRLQHLVRMTRQGKRFGRVQE